MFGEGASDFEESAPKASHQIECFHPTDQDRIFTDILAAAFFRDTPLWGGMQTRLAKPVEENQGLCSWYRDSSQTFSLYMRNTMMTRGP
jgi:hypothetical protein